MLAFKFNPRKIDQVLLAGFWPIGSADGGFRLLDRQKALAWS